MYDLIILGGGPAGYNAAERAGHAGLKTLVIEERALGGVCLNEGCIPTKTLLYSAKIYDYAKPSVYFMAKHKIINGIGNNLFAPKATTSQEIAIGYALATREQALAMSLRSLENLGGK